MLDCWRMNPDRRPTFSECKRLIVQFLEKIDTDAHSIIEEQLSNESSKLIKAARKLQNRDNSPESSSVAIDSFCDSEEQQVNVINPLPALEMTAARNE